MRQIRREIQGRQLRKIKWARTWERKLERRLERVGREFGSDSQTKPLPIYIFIYI